MDSSHTCRRSLGHKSDTRTQAPDMLHMASYTRGGHATLECDRKCRAAGARAREPPPCACARPPEWGRRIRPRPRCSLLSAAATALGTSASACLARPCCTPSRREAAQPAHGSRDRADAAGLLPPSSASCPAPSAASCGAVRRLQHLHNAVDLREHSPKREVNARRARGVRGAHVPGEGLAQVASTLRGFKTFVAPRAHVVPCALSNAPAHLHAQG